MRVLILCLIFASLPLLGAFSSADELLQQLFRDEWEQALRDDPLKASYVGDRRYEHLWPEIGLADQERRHRQRQQVLRRLASIPFEELSQENRLNYRLFQRKYEMEVEAYPYGWHLVPLTQREGIQTIDEYTKILSFSDSAAYEAWITRLETFPRYMDQTMELMREGIRKGIVHARVVMERVPHQIRAQIVEDPTQSLLYRPFHEFPDSIGAGQREVLAERAQKALAERAIPAFRKFYHFFTTEYLPACKEAVGVWQLPQGKEFYAHRAGLFTTTDLTPKQIHELGRAEVRRIRSEMEQIIEQVGFAGTFEEFLHFLRTDPQFYYSSGEELLAAYRALSKQLDPTLVKLFRRLPRMPYGVEPIPDHIAPDTTTAYYLPPAADGSRSGTYFVNLYQPEVRPKYEMEALSIHEAVPGHHLQIALAMEMGDLPAFRRYDGYTAFVEGWALYAESLGTELGFYSDPYSKFGQLTYEMWRAVRLVVDTGIHDFGWTRQQAIDFFRENAAKTERDIVNEIDRYIAWPGQALAYKIGELKIKELRALAERRLGQRFDIRVFHEVVLESGAVSLDVLEERVQAWIESMLQ